MTPPAMRTTSIVLESPSTIWRQFQLIRPQMICTNVACCAEMQKPLALAVIGGLGFSTVVTLYAVPAVYARLAGGQPANGAL